MTPLFWISLAWVLATVAVARLPLRQRYLPGGLLLLTAVPILVSIGLTVGWFMAVLGLAAIASLFPSAVRMFVAWYRGEVGRVDGRILRFLVVPGDL